MTSEEQLQKEARLWSAWAHDYVPANHTSLTCARCLKHRDDQAHRLGKNYGTNGNPGSPDSDHIPAGHPGKAGLLSSAADPAEQAD